MSRPRRKEEAHTKWAEEVLSGQGHGSGVREAGAGRRETGTGSQAHSSFCTVCFVVFVQDFKFGAKLSDRHKSRPQTTKRKKMAGQRTKNIKKSQCHCLVLNCIYYIAHLPVKVYRFLSFFLLYLDMCLCLS